MKFSPFTLLLFALFGFSAIFSQNMDLNWSDPVIMDNKLDGFFSSFIGTNNAYTYVKYSNLAYRTKKQNRKIVIKVLDKVTMKEKYRRTIVDYSNGKDKEKYSGLAFYRGAVFDNVIYLFWKKESSDKDELYVRTFDPKFKPTTGLKKIYEVKKEKGSGVKQPEIFVLSNDKAGDNMLIGAELAAQKGQSIKVECKLLKSDLTFIQQSQVELPVSKIGRSYDGFLSDYEYGDGGKLFIYSYIVPTKEERRELRRGDGVITGYFDIISCIDPANGNIKSYTLKFDRKFIRSYKATVDKNVLKVTGFFSDLDKDPKGNDYHGIFYVALDDNEMTPLSTNFSYFSASQLDELFAADKQDRKDRAGIFASKKKRESEQESVSSAYRIEEVIKASNGDLVLFASIMYNYTIQQCSTSSNGVRTCTTHYYCQKDNITAFRLGSAGELVWAKNMDRRKTYSGWNVYDVSAVSKDDKYYVVYGSDYMTTAKKKNRRSSKSRTHSIDRMEYAVFDGTNGSVAKAEEVINRIGVKKDEKKYIHPSDIYVYNNTFYIPSERIKMKVGRTVLSCVTLIVCPPVGCFMLASPKNRRGIGYIGKMSPK